MTEYDGIPDDDIWNIKFEELEFTQEIAGGSFGKVYLGNYLGMEVAIKQIFRHNDPAYMKYIEREISVLKSVRHPFIVSFVGVCLHESGLYIVTEYINGGDVRQMLKNSKPSWQKRVQIVSDLAKAMYYLHSKKIIHRDLKSKNLLIGSDGRIRLCDFGFARLSEFRRKRVMTICGTPGFVAPEIMLGQDYDETCDMFSFGNVMAELITLLRPGRDFWIRSSDSNYQLNFDELKNITPKDCPPAFLDICLRCCAFDPATRPTFPEIIKELKKVEDSLPKEVPLKLNRTGSGINNGANRTQKTNTLRLVSQLDEAPPADLGLEFNIPQQEVQDEEFGQSYIVTIQKEKLQLTSGENTMSTKHLIKMIQRGTNPDFLENDFVMDLLLTYPCFTTPLDLLNGLIVRYQEAPPGKDQDTIQKKHKMIQIRTIVFLNTWVEKFPDDFLVPGMQEICQKFDDITQGEYKLIKALERINNSRERKFIRKLPQLPSQQISIQKILQLRSTDLATQTTVILYDIFRSITPREYLKDAWKRRRISHMKEFMIASTQITRFVCSCLVNTEEKEKRTALLTKFLDVAQGCFNLKNFEGVFAIMKALSHPSIERMSGMFKGLSPAWQESLRTLKQFTSKEDLKPYKEKQETSNSPCVPYLNMFTEELSFIDSSNLDISKGGIINFSKHQKLARIIRHLQQWGSSTYSIKPDDTLFQLLMYSEVDDDEALKRKSMLCEPPSSIVV